MADPARNGSLRYVVEPMQVRHIPAVSAIERESFPVAWPASAYRREIERNNMAYYVVARLSPVGAQAIRTRRFRPSQPSTPEADEHLFLRLARRILGEDQRYTEDEATELESIVGYAGVWLMVDEAHITTIAVDPAYRGEGVGELLLVDLLERSRELGATDVTLECRVSNYVAQRLYRKYTFRNAGLRKRYYSDDGEDALIMTTEPLDAPAFRETLARNRARLIGRLSVGGGGRSS